MTHTHTYRHHEDELYFQRKRCHRRMTNAYAIAVQKFHCQPAISISVIGFRFLPCAWHDLCVILVLFAFKRKKKKQYTQRLINTTGLMHAKAARCVPILHMQIKLIAPRRVELLANNKDFFDFFSVFLLFLFFGFFSICFVCLFNLFVHSAHSASSHPPFIYVLGLETLCCFRFVHKMDSPKFAIARTAHTRHT